MKHIREFHYDVYFIVGILLFLIFSFIIVPFFHELGHVIVLKYHNCSYWANLEYGFFNKFYGEIYQKCMLNSKAQALVYIGGVTLTFIIGIILLISEYIVHRRSKIHLAIPLMFLSYAFLLDFINYLFFTTGDIINAMNILGKNTSYLPLIGILLVIALLTYLYINLNKELHAIVIEEEHMIKKIRKSLKEMFK